MKNTKHLICVVIALLVTVVPALAQISYESKASHRQEKKRLRREARAAAVTADYKETHLNTGIFNFKKGKASRKPLVKDNSVAYTFKDTKPVKMKNRKNMKRSRFFKKRD